MKPDDDEEERRLRSVAIQNASAILLARQRAERELATERERLRITLASIGDAVISTDARGRVTYLNGVAETLTGWTQAEAAGRPLADIFHIVNEHTRQPVENPALKTLQEGVVVGLANHSVLIARDGTERPIDDSAAPMLDESGVPVGAVLVFRDVSERRQAEVAQARLAAIVESSQDAIVSKTLDGVIRTWNSGAERLFGYTAEEAVGRPITLLIPTDRLDEEREILARLSRGERVEHYETVRMAKDGRRLDISLTISPMRDAQGRIVGASKVARDVTERRRAEEALRASEERFRTLTAHAPVGIFLTDREGNCLFVNERWCDMAGLTPEEARGQGWVRALHPEDKERVFREWSAAVEAGTPFASEYRFRTPAGKETWLDGNASGLRDESGQVSEYIGTLTDITERREAVEALREADRRKDEFLALLAHELRNPLAPLRNGLEVMRLATSDARAVAKARDIMDRQLSHMVRLIDDLLDISRISRNKMELRRSRVLLADVVSSAVETARPVLQAAGHELTVSLPPEPVHLDADLTRLAQLFANLLNNSAKYTQRGGHVWLTATREGRQVSVAVRDTGIGIPAFALPNIFDMFSQVDRSIERSTGGLGIGLALVKGLAEMHGGTVEAASPGEGKGSTFTIRLPVLLDREESPPETPAEERPDASGEKRRILVVDDSQDSAASMAMMLRLLGNEVRTAHDGLEALRCAEHFRPQVVLMDIGMPRLNGYEATRHIREQPWGRDMAIIALTGWGQEVDRARSLEAGCNGHLVKPVSLPDLEKLLVELHGVKGCSILDAPSDLGLRRTGVDGLPDALRAAGLLEGLPDARYAGRLAVPPYVPLRDAASNVLNPDGIRTFSFALAERLAFTLDLGRFPVVLGGDCSVLLGAALALRRRGRFGLFFLDGHGDFYPPSAEPNGEVASMELAIVTGREPAVLADLEGRRPLVREEDVVVFGYRDAESAAEYGSPDVRQTAMHTFDLAQVRRMGPAAAARQGLAALEANGVEGFWIHLDADVLHDDVMPAVDYRMPDGLWPEELSEALAVVLASPLAVGMEVTIYNPAFDDAERSAARVLARAVTAAFATRRRSSAR